MNSLPKLLNITLAGRIPSKKNSKQIVRNPKTKKLMLISQKSHNPWHEEKSWELARYRPSSPIQFCSIAMRFYFPDNIKTDLTNKAESVMDLLCDNDILQDDNHFVCYSLHLISMGVDKSKPRVEITISYEDNPTSAQKDLAKSGKASRALWRNLRNY